MTCIPNFLIILICNSGIYLYYMQKGITVILNNINFIRIYCIRIIKTPDRYFT